MVGGAIKEAEDTYADGEYGEGWYDCIEKIRALLATAPEGGEEGEPSRVPLKSDGRYCK